MSKSVKKKVSYIALVLVIIIAIFSTKAIKHFAMKRSENNIAKIKQRVDSDDLQDDIDFEISYNEKDVFEEQKFLSLKELQ